MNYWNDGDKIDDAPIFEKIKEFKEKQTDYSLFVVLGLVALIVIVLVKCAFQYFEEKRIHDENDKEVYYENHHLRDTIPSNDLTTHKQTI